MYYHLIQCRKYGYDDVIDDYDEKESDTVYQHNIPNTAHETLG